MQKAVGRDKINMKSRIQSVTWSPVFYPQLLCSMSSGHVNKFHQFCWWTPVSIRCCLLRFSSKSSSFPFKLPKLSSTQQINLIKKHHRCDHGCCASQSKIVPIIWSSRSTKHSLHVKITAQHPVKVLQVELSVKYSGHSSMSTELIP